MDVETIYGPGHLDNREQLMGFLAALLATDNLKGVSIRYSDGYIDELSRRVTGRGTKVCTVRVSSCGCGRSIQCHHDIKVIETPETRNMKYRVLINGIDMQRIVAFDDPDFLAGINTAIQWYDLKSEIVGRIFTFEDGKDVIMT